MIGRKQRELRYGALCIERDRRCEAFVGIFGGAHEIGVFDLVWQIDFEPIGRIMLGDIRFEPVLRPVFHRLAEFILRNGDTLGAIDLGESTGEHGLGLVIKRADQLRLPAVPHAGADRADIRGRKNRK